MASVARPMEVDGKIITADPTTETKYVVLEGITYGNRFITSWTSRSTKHNIVRIATGEVRYEILGFAPSISAAQAFLGIPKCWREQW